MRTNSICCVTIALYSDNQEEPEYEGMYIEADTPEEAYQHDWSYYWRLSRLDMGKR